MRLLLDRHLVQRRRLVHPALVLLRLVLRRRVVLCVDAVHLVKGEVPRRRLQSPGLLRVVDLRGEASRSAVDVATGLHVDVVLVVDEVPRRRQQPPGLLPAYPLQRPSASFVATPTRLPYAFTASGEFPDIAHVDSTFGFTEYAHAVGTTQPKVSRTTKEARATPETA